VGIASGGIAVLAVLAVVVAFAVVPKHLTAPASTPTPIPRTGDAPADVVGAFVSALRTADAKTALSYVDDVPSDTTYLTAQMLRASNRIAPITNVHIGKSTRSVADYRAMVPMTYEIGDQKFRTTMRLNQLSEGDEWLLSDPTVRVTVGHLAPVGLTMNGVAVSGEEVTVFPGIYRLAVTHPAFTVDGATKVTVGFGKYPSLRDTDVTLSDAGRATFLELLKTDVDACIASTKLEAGCGIVTQSGSEDGSVVVDGTLTRRLSASAMKELTNLETRPSFDNPLLVEGFIGGRVDTSAKCQKDGVQIACDYLSGTRFGIPVVDFSTSPASITWEPEG
jgi:hypothetical protein